MMTRNGKGGLAAAAMGVLLLAMPQAGQAGGLAEAVPVAVAPAAPAPVFEGFYVGGALGYAFSGEDRVGIFPPGGGTENRVGTMELEGAYGDLHVGHWWQRGRTVFGLELGVQAGGPSDSISTANGKAKSRMRHALTLRGMLGQQFGAATMGYVFAGASTGEFAYKASDGAADISKDITMSGYVVGLGVEHALNENWFVRGEVQHASYGKKRVKDAAGFYTHATPKFTSVTLGVDYRF